MESSWTVGDAMREAQGWGATVCARVLGLPFERYLMNKLQPFAGPQFFDIYPETGDRMWLGVYYLVPPWGNFPYGIAVEPPVPV